MGNLPGQEMLLNQAGNLQLLLQAFSGADLRFLFTHELGHPNRRGGLRGQVLEQPAIVTRVVLVAEPWTQAEHADQLALTDQRHHQPDTGGAQGCARR
jgi:hypothetical protein